LSEFWDAGTLKILLQECKDHFCHHVTSSLTTGAKLTPRKKHNNFSTLKVINQFTYIEVLLVYCVGSSLEKILGATNGLVQTAERTITLGLG
jgi:hypothetical protein